MTQMSTGPDVVTHVLFCQYRSVRLPLC